MEFEFATAQRIVFGPGSAAQISALAPALGKRLLLVTGSSSRHARVLTERLSAADVDVMQVRVMGEPTVDSVSEIVRRARDATRDLVIGLGGGSVLDTAKAVAALAANEGPVRDFLEVVGPGKPLAQSPLPVIAVPTTSGTGSEVTRNAVLGVPDRQVKVSLRSPRMLPRIAVVDPLLTYSLPADWTAFTGLDAMTQVLEPLVSCRANPLTDALCREGLRRAARSLPRAVRDGRNAEARQDMALASLFGGLALANAKLGAVHGFAGPFGGMFNAPHGAVCAALLPHVMAVNIRALRARSPRHPALNRFREIARIVTGHVAATLDDGIEWVAALTTDLKIPGLARYGLDATCFSELISKAARSSSMQGNPVELTESELAEILAHAS